MIKFWQKIFVFQMVAIIFAALPAFAQNFAPNGSSGSSNVGGFGLGNDSGYTDPSSNYRPKSSDFMLSPEEYAKKKALQDSGVLNADGSINLNVKDSTAGVTGQTALEFANEYGLTINGIKAEEILSEKGNVYCGSTSNKCNKYTHVCWRCSIRDDKLVGRKRYEKGICLRGDYNSTAQTAYNECAQFRKDNANFFTGTAVWRYNTTQSPTGFLIEDESRLFWFIKTYDNEEERTFIGKGPDGQEHKYVLAYDQGNPTLKYADEGNTKGCEVLPIKLNKMSGCFFCPLARVIFDTANDAAILSFFKFAPSFQSLIVIAFAVWLAFASLNIVFTFTKQDANKHITSMLKQGGKFLFAYFLLSYPQDLFSLFVSPILSTGLEMGDKIKAEDLNSLVNLGDSYTGEKGGGEYFAIGGIYGKIEAFLTGVQQQLAVLQAIGSSLFCVGGNEITWKNLIGEGTIMYSLRAYMLGAILFVFGLMLTVTFAFYFMDALLQLSILGAMLPMMIAGWPFKVTAKYATDGLKMLLNTTFIMFFTGFVVSVEITLIDSALDYVNNNADMEVKTKAGGTDSGLNAMFNAINNQDTKAIQDLTDIGGKGFLLIIFAAIFGFKFVTQVPKMANKLAGGVNLGISSKVATMMASSAKGTALKATKPLRKAASTWWHQGGGLVGRVAKVGKIPGAIIGIGNKLAHKAGIENTLVDKFQNRLSEAAKKHQDAAREASLKGGLGNRIRQKWHEGLAKREQATAEHGLVGGLSARIEEKAKGVHKTYLASEEYNEARQKDEDRLRRRRGETSDD